MGLGAGWKDAKDKFLNNAENAAKKSAKIIGREGARILNQLSGELEDFIKDKQSTYSGDMHCANLPINDSCLEGFTLNKVGCCSSSDEI